MPTTGAQRIHSCARDCRFQSNALYCLFFSGVHLSLKKNSERKKGSTYTTLKQLLKPNNILPILSILKIFCSVFAVSIFLVLKFTQ